MASAFSLLALSFTSSDKQLQFSWNNSYGNGIQPTDLLSTLIWYDEGGIYEASTSAAQRADETFIYNLKYPGGQVFADVYVRVLSDDSERAADSYFLGRVEL
ncbi:hypothetical protein [Pedobacter ghigonis]|uniref:hypothetical protein n=1 Tax=Pedobacter ghigonis TaxID=2730403 RepID=UPI00158B41FC|nr:hypothetical protein [Pedobacter ghigonis]